MNIDSIIVCEPENTADFYPFSVLHAVWEIRCGGLMLFEKIERYFPDSNIFYYGRQKHLDSFAARYGRMKATFDPVDTLAIDSTLVFTEATANLFKSEIDRHLHTENSAQPLLLTIEKHPVAAFIPGNEILNITSQGIFNYKGTSFPSLVKVLENIIESDIQGETLHYLWDAIELTGKSINGDRCFFANQLQCFDKADYEGAWGIESDNILLGEDVRIAPTAVLDASRGSIIIGNNAKIMPHATILGPCYIGDNSLVKIGAKIYPDCSFGPWCKIGGEIENSVIQGYSNKQHDGFLGHSYLGEWINLGADTNNSDLKNTYSNITVQLDDREINTGRMFLGLLCGDHTKSGINTMFTTGTVCGICSILVREWFLPRFIPSFSWGGGKDSPAYKASKALEIAKIVMSRRNCTLLPEEEALIVEEYERVK